MINLNLVEQIQFHRYRYYVMYDPLITDLEYDMLDRKALEQFPDDPVLNSVGSELISSYPQHIIDLAESS